MSKPDLVDSLRVAKENERIASETYAEAAKIMQNPRGKELFEQLSKWEGFHYGLLADLEKSLKEKGNFIKYWGKEFPLPPLLEIKAADEPQNSSIVKIISDAMNLERRAEETYADLALQVTDPMGHDLFSRLSQDEHTHYRILSGAYWTLTNLGTWKWPFPGIE
jgi:rubrerythrin